MNGCLILVIKQERNKTMEQIKAMFEAMEIDTEFKREINELIETVVQKCQAAVQNM